MDGAPPHVEGAVRSSTGITIATASTDTYAPGAGFSLTFLIPPTATPGTYTVHLTATKTNPSGGANHATPTPTYGMNREVTVFVGTTRALYATGDIRVFVASGPVIITEAGGLPTPLPLPFLATAVGPHSVVWVEYDSSRGGPAESIPAEASTMFRDEFETNDFPNEVFGTFHGEAFNGLFGTPQDVDNEPHVHLLYFNIGLVYPSCPGCFFVGGYYFGLGSEVNMKDILHMNRFHDAPQVTPGTTAHEFQHMITDNMDSGEPTWTNEGLSDVAIMITYGIGGVAGHISSYNAFSDTGLTEWGHVQITANYGAAFLFMQYLIDHFDPRTTGRFPAGDRPDRIITELVRTPADSGDGVTDALHAAGFPFSFRDVFENWAVANYVDDPTFPTPGEGYDAAYGYRAFRIRSFGDLALQGIRTAYPFGPTPQDVEAWGTEYIALRPGGSSGTLNVFVDEIPNVPVAPHSGAHAWWSGDAGTSTNFLLQQDVSLIGTRTPRLSFFLYYNTETGFDFGYVEASTNGGGTWDLLGTVTGSSAGQFVPFTVDLSTYADRIIRLRFRYEQDTGNDFRLTPGLPGLLLDDLQVSDGAQTIFSDDMETPGTWETPGGPSPNPATPAVAWKYYPVQTNTVLVQAVSLSGATRQAVTSQPSPAEINVLGFGSTVTEVVLAISSRVDGYPDTPYSQNSTFRLSARILESTQPQVSVSRAASAAVDGERFPISGNRVAPGQQVEMAFTVGVTKAPVNGFTLTERAPASWGPSPSLGGATSVSTSTSGAVTTITWTWSHIPAESSSSVSYRATAPAQEGTYTFGPAGWAYSYPGGSGSGAEPAGYGLTVSRSAERYFTVQASGNAYTIPGKNPVWPVDITMTWRRVSDDGKKAYFEVTAGRVVVHTSQGDEAWQVTSGTGTFDRKNGEVSITATTDRGDSLTLRGPASWDGNGAGSLSVDVHRSKIHSRYFLQGTGQIRA